MLNILFPRYGYLCIFVRFLCSCVDITAGDFFSENFVKFKYVTFTICNLKVTAFNIFV
jgi:hypothetical protein